MHDAQWLKVAHFHLLAQIGAAGDRTKSIKMEDSKQHIRLMGCFGLYVGWLFRSNATHIVVGHPCVSTTAMPSLRHITLTEHWGLSKSTSDKVIIAKDDINLNLMQIDQICDL